MRYVENIDLYSRACPWPAPRYSDESVASVATRKSAALFLAAQNNVKGIAHMPTRINIYWEDLNFSVVAIVHTIQNRNADINIVNSR